MIIESILTSIYLLGSVITLPIFILYGLVLFIITGDIKKSIKTLLYYEILEKGDSNSGIDGYRFTF